MVLSSHFHILPLPRGERTEVRGKATHPAQLCVKRSDFKALTQMAALRCTDVCPGQVGERLSQALPPRAAVKA